MPEDIKIILFESGFSSLLSLSLLKEQHIIQIENYINSKRHILDLLKDYNSSEIFRLMPGYRSVIIGLAGKVQEYLDKKEEHTKNRRSELLLKNRNTENIKSDIELKNELINKVSNYLIKLNYSVKLDINTDLADFHRDESVCRCRVKCKFCDNLILCSFKTYWAVSNLESHLKKHILSIEKQILEKKRTEATEKNTTA